MSITPPTLIVSPAFLVDRMSCIWQKLLLLTPAGNYFNDIRIISGATGGRLGQIIGMVWSPCIVGRSKSQDAG
ncbi:hypothetical protein CGGC5_v005315 [Colletotrichum fructicola Nara gc5]|uniref:Uncharacterized protein n=1 Tax=Colletotrichum fructicola (strain Nara gc5) TaxID=1213859 RepID=A0A7J6JC81_COLFN|nr:hypothetical protein CGGC5_v005315 [Colletotrichum fructicola Nara gc5]